MQEKSLWLTVAESWCWCEFKVVNLEVKCDNSFVVYTVNEKSSRNINKIKWKKYNSQLDEILTKTNQFSYELNMSKGNIRSNVNG